MSRRLLVLLALGASLACVPPALLPPGGAQPDGGVVAVRSPFMAAFVYVVPTADGGVVLVDSGTPALRADLLAAAAGRPVRAILLTHGHVDHAAGVAAWPEVPVYVGRGDLPRLLGAAAEPDVLPELGWILYPRPEAAARFHPVDDGDEVRVGGTRFTAVAVPGHTAGSTAWLVGEVVFTGDALLAARPGRVELSYWFYSDDLDEARRSIAHLAARRFRVMYDGHYGRTDGAHDRVEAWLRRPPARDLLHGLDRAELVGRW